MVRTCMNIKCMIEHKGSMAGMKGMEGKTVWKVWEGVRVWKETQAAEAETTVTIVLVGEKRGNSLCHARREV
jgi:hypothetical protein